MNELKHHTHYHTVALGFELMSRHPHKIRGEQGTSWDGLHLLLTRPKIFIVVF